MEWPNIFCELGSQTRELYAALGRKFEYFLTCSLLQVGVSGDLSAHVTNIVGLVRSQEIDTALVVTVLIVSRLKRGLVLLSSVKIWHYDL